MKTVFCLALVLLFAPAMKEAHGGPHNFTNDGRPRLSHSSAAPQKTTRRRHRRKSRASRKLDKPMPQTDSTNPPDEGPRTDTPNRMEIDPGDIPPSKRPTNPNVDDRTKIPEWVSPDDMAPRPKPKRKRP